MLDWDISKRYDLPGEPLQFYLQYNRADCETRELLVNLLPEPYADIPAWLATIRELLDAIEAAYERDRQRAFGWSWG